MKCQPWVLLPVGAWRASSRHSRITSGSTGRERSSRLRTERVVVNKSSMERSRMGIVVLLFKNRANGFMSVFFQDRIFSFYLPQVYQGSAKHASFYRISGV